MYCLQFKNIFGTAILFNLLLTCDLLAGIGKFSIFVFSPLKAKPPCLDFIRLKYSDKFLLLRH